MRDKQSLQVVAHIRVILHQQHPGSFFVSFARSGGLPALGNELTDIWKPSKSFLDVRLCPGSRGCKCGAGTDALARQMRGSKRYANVKALPRCGSLSTETSPPCSFASSCTNARLAETNIYVVFKVMLLIESLSDRLRFELIAVGDLEPMEVTHVLARQGF